MPKMLLPKGIRSPAALAVSYSDEGVKLTEDADEAGAGSQCSGPSGAFLTTE
jgi:hypothetical protein